MALLAVSKLGKSFGERKLFSDVSFEIGVKDRVGLVGVNGCGKTTLLHMMAGFEDVSEGQVYKSRDCAVGYLAQTPEIRSEQTLYDFVLEVFRPLLDMEAECSAIAKRIVENPAEAEELVHKQERLQSEFERLGGLTAKSRARAALLGLGFTEQEFSVPMSAVSGGQAGKAMLARILLSGANLLLLDEPTNHLDITAVEWLEGFLKSYSGAFVVISHDRYFLDAVTKRTLELYNGALLSTQGNYSTHVERKSTAQEIALRHYRNTQREIRRIEGIVEQQRRWNKERNIRTAESKLKQIERLKQTLVVPERDPASIRFTFTAREGSGNEVLAAKGLQKAYDGKPLFSGLDLLLQKNERVFLLGPNGCGKTTLLRILTGKETADMGTYYPGANVDIAYYEQNMRGLNPENTVLNEVWNAYPKLGQTAVRNALAAFLFRNDDVDKPIRALSGGEKARVQLLKLMLSGANLLLLDEPTNHLDIASREALENALEEYGGTLFVVTHDRYLVNRLADRVLYMTQTGITETIGGYTEFLQHLQEEREAAQETAQPAKQNSYKAEKERISAINRGRGAVSRLEQQIEAQEAMIAQKEELLASPGVAADYVKAAALAQELEDERARLTKLYEDWEAADQTLAALIGQEEAE